MSDQSPQGRLSYGGELEPVLARASEQFELGLFRDYQTVPVGYEDFNAIVATDRGRYFAKIFSADRTPENIERYREIMQAVVGDGAINHPSMHYSKSGLVYHDSESQLDMVMMDYIEGRTYYDSKQLPTPKALGQILRQAVVINGLTLHPDFMYDTWAIPNIDITFAQVQDAMPDRHRRLAERAITDFQDLDLEALPHRFVHGDLVKSNVLDASNGEQYILDFAVANWYPRIQELAVLIANLLNSLHPHESFLATLKRVTNGYIAAGGQLTVEEARALPAYTRAAYASLIVAASKEKYVNKNDSTENDYFLQLGLVGLIQSLESK